jgi:endoglucanase
VKQRPSRGALLALLASLGCSPKSDPLVPEQPRRGEAARERLAGDVPAVRVNQLGYLPGSSKLAAVVSAAREAQPWRLLDASGSTLANGLTLALGLDATSGDPLHVVDFTRFDHAGSELVLAVGEARSDAFAIDTALYAKLARDALRFFYHMRSGTPITLPFAEDLQWVRPAGHQPDVARCEADSGCDYSLDVTGGWYDAGDQGKYVVNGGLSTWLLQNAHERALALGRDRSLLGDRFANIPESGNGLPDILDEARWELEFLLEMQVPEGQPQAGMVHHKMHDLQWTPLGTAPHEDAQPRVLRPVSTAATLNLAAVAAQAARLWAELDAAFARECLQAAERAWRAAQTNPVRLAPASDNRGGGAYDDDRVADEFYWAAAELFVTTHEPVYLRYLDASPHDDAIAPDLIVAGEALSSAVSWGRVDVLGKLSLVLDDAAGARHSGSAKYQRQLADFAEHLLATLRGQGYRLPMQPAPDGKYPWGSNADVLGNMVLLAGAADASGDARFAEGVVAGMDYLLGRNAMGQSYVTGYGARPLKNPHHRFWARQANARYPEPPPGAVSGGPNSHLQDPYAASTVPKDCPPQKCFVDNIAAYSLNEVAINWNAALTWSAIWLDQWARR